MKLKFIATALLLLLVCLVQAQEKDEKTSVEELYLDANSYFFFEDYEEALALYQQVVREIPKNSNLSYRIGICYLNIPGKKNKSIPFLETATASTSKRYKENSIKEANAPIESFFFLGSAYLANNQLSKAKEAFLKFQSLTGKKDTDYDISMLKLQLGTIESSKAIQKKPINFLLSNLGQKINDRFSNFSPTLSYNGQVLAYTSKRKFYQAVFVARKKGNEWSTPVNITPELETDQNLKTLSLNFDGTELYLYKDDNRDGNIYVSHYRNGRWNPIEDIGSNINTKYWEASAAISPDGKTLYFSSNREGGYGELDLYKSRKLPNGTWDVAQNLGPNINSAYNEIAPSLTSTGTTLFYASDGFLGLGGYDIYFANASKGDEWSKPENLGYPINTSDDDIEFCPIDDGQYGLLARFDEDSYGEMDIFKIEIFSERYAKEVVMHNQLELRKRSSSKKSLVIDTVNAQKLALILPEGLNLDDYSDANKRIKLYFEGKRYNLRDQVNLLASKKGNIEEAPTNFVPINAQAISDLENTQKSNSARDTDHNRLETRSFSNLNIPFLLDIRFQTNLTQQIRSLIEDIFYVPGMPHSTKENSAFAASNSDNQATQFYRIFKSIGLNIPQSIFTTAQNTQSGSPLFLMASLLKAQKSGIISSDELLNALIVYLDKFAANRDNSYISYSKTGSIKKDRSGSTFLALANLLKAKASGKLKLMLNSIDPETNHITTFDQLIALLKSIDEVEFQNYKQELISIMAEIASEEFYSLNAQARNDLTLAFERPSAMHIIKYTGGFILAIGAFIFLLILAKKRKQKKRDRK
ncbi:PD40 domain-containing protein [Williamwhitmania taraxaci]|uniref:WD40-like Beta Propeller Repeat n=1 Tax=Williamwhitmania taraxaci TaxID=1640674 RepID=A0A1G6GT13_9BACT|nr:PD40 domain-containing protein [Williamwhitmania taraxaci]SDB84825.1 WD40-like Beta Propeller Repeat [Williamwhitmania taraxaci]